MDTSTSVAKNGAATAPKPRKTLLGALRKSTASDSSESSSDSDNASDSEDDIPVPAKSLAKPKSQSRKVSPEVEEEEADADAAYQRMRQRLAAAKAKTQDTQKDAQDTPQEMTEQASNLMSAISSGSEDDEPVKKPTRKAAPAAAKSSSPPRSPSPRIQSRHSTPGLFVSPNPSPMKPQSRVVPGNDSDSDGTTQRKRDAELGERVKRIRAERLAKQKEEEAQRTQNTTDNAGSDSDGEADRRLTQQAKPTRRAGKKAIEAMARDQQRISRNMQLTHQTKTRKRFSTKDLFSRFGFNGAEEAAVTLPTPDASSAVASSDAEAAQMRETPPKSPQKPDGSDEQDAGDAEKVDKGKGRAPEFQHLPPHSWEQHPKPIVVQRVQVPEKASNNDMVELSDSDDDTAKPKSRFPVFDRVPLRKQKEPSSILHLRHLAHLTSPKNTRKGPKTISVGEMNWNLAQKSRQQMQKARQERLEELKRRGIHIETEEEREKNQMEIEDIVAQFEKQREEDLKLAKMERKEAKANGEAVDDLPSSDDSDDDFVGSDEENANENADEQDDDESEAELELSGSEDEEMVEVEEADASNTEGATKDESLVAASSEQHVEEDAEMEDAVPAPTGRKQTANRAKRRVIDEDDSDGETRPSTPTKKATQDVTKAAFGFGTTNMGMGLTQMFAGTMANLESDSQAAGAPEAQEQDSFDFLRNLPDTQPAANFSQADETLVPNSQLVSTPKKEVYNLGISQLGTESPGFSSTQPDEVPEPTQDVGFSFSRSPAGVMAPDSTVETVMMEVTESPIKQRKGRLQRGLREATVELSEPESDFSDVDDIQRPPKHRDAFRAMQKGVKKQKAIDDFNKKTSAAKEIVEEQADESEDEYAGLGGASDDDSGEEDEDMKKMINDQNDEKIDERKIAAFYADQSKRNDEKNINQLYKDLMNGGLRKRAGRDAFDMSDSEDEAEMKQRKKRADFQRMRKALLGDEKIGKIAENPKQQAFFKTLADFADDADYDFLDMPAELEAPKSQSQEVVEDAETADSEVIPDSQTSGAAVRPNPLKRKSPSASQKENRPPPHLRRTAEADNMGRKPMTLEDVQHSVSELLEDERIMVPDSQYMSDEGSDDDEPAARTTTRKPIVDRLTLSRQSTLDSSATDTGLAFSALSRTAGASSFRVPSLIRQATSSLSASSDRSSGHSTPVDNAVRRGGTGRSNIHAQAREAERRAVLEKKETKRKEALKRKVDVGRRSGMRSVLGDLGGGFE